MVEEDAGGWSGKSLHLKARTQDERQAWIVSIEHMKEAQGVAPAGDSGYDATTAGIPALSDFRGSGDEAWSDDDAAVTPTVNVEVIGDKLEQIKRWHLTLLERCAALDKTLDSEATDLAADAAPGVEAGLRQATASLVMASTQYLARATSYGHDNFRAP